MEAQQEANEQKRGARNAHLQQCASAAAYAGDVPWLLRWQGGGRWRDRPRRKQPTPVFVTRPGPRQRAAALLADALSAAKAVAEPPPSHVQAAGRSASHKAHLLSPKALPPSCHSPKQRGCRRTVALHTQRVEDELTRRRAARLAAAVGALSALVAVDAEAADALAAAAAQLPCEGLELLQAGILSGSPHSASKSAECQLL